MGAPLRQARRRRTAGPSQETDPLGGDRIRELGDGSWRSIIGTPASNSQLPTPVLFPSGSAGDPGKDTTVTRHAWARLALALVALLSFVRPSSAAVTGFITEPGYVAEDLRIKADTFAVAPDGRFAVASGSAITVYNHADPARRQVVAVVGSPSFKSLGGMAFAGADTLIVTDNTYLAGAIYRVSIGTGAVTTLAAPGTANDVAQVRTRPTDGAVFAVEAHAVKHGEVVRVTPAGVVPFASGLGTGYLGGLVFDAAGNIYVGDTNDPYFMNNAGKVLKLNPSGALIADASLAGGGGHGVYDLAGFNGDYFATTGNTITRLHGGVATKVGTFTTAYPFPTDLAVDAGSLLVNGVYAGVGGVFRVSPAAPVLGRTDSWRPGVSSRYGNDERR